MLAKRGIIMSDLKDISIETFFHLEMGLTLGSQMYYTALRKNINTWEWRTLLCYSRQIIELQVFKASEKQKMELMVY